MSGYTIRQVDHVPFSRRIDAPRIDGVKLPKRPREAQSRGWRASALPACLRTTAYRLADIPATHDTYDPDYDRAARQGSLLHENLQLYMIAAGDLLYEHPEFGPAIELPLDRCCDPALADVRAALKFTGHIDGILVTKDGSLCVWDLKSVSSGDLAPGNRYFADKLQKYACQVNIYAHFFATPDGRKATGSFVLVVSRDNTKDRRMYHVPYQPERAEAEIARLQAAHAAVARGELPVAEPERNGCRFCGWRGVCSENTYS